jgi:Gpi18-like mannosyltransferase
MLKKILFSFLTWRAALFLIAFLSIYFLPVFGARFPYADRVLEITHLPYWVWGFGNFDGVHYLRIAQDGYLAQYSQAFFPLFPILIRFFSFIFPRTLSLDLRLFTDPAYFYSGIILSNVFFLGAIYVLYKLIAIDFKKDIAFLSVILLLVLPTSYFFGSIYTESLFLLLAVSAIYLIRKGNFFWAAVLISLSTVTRITGVLLIPLYLVEVFQSKKKINYVWALVTPLGILAYMYYLKVAFNDPFYFLTSQPVFGAGRIGNGIVLLPQVIYRYIKIFLTTNILSLPFFNAFLEFMSTLVPLAFLVAFIKKMRLSYWVFSISALLLGTLTGTFSSMPRYALISVIFLLPLLIRRFRKFFWPVAVVSAVLGIFLLMLFVRGYWVA